jgi:hypothetical protein
MCLLAKRIREHEYVYKMATDAWAAGTVALPHWAIN